MSCTPNHRDTNSEKTKPEEIITEKESRCHEIDSSGYFECWSFEEALENSVRVKKIILRFNKPKLKTLPPEIINLVNLEHLEMNHNQLTTLPPEIGRLSKLENLYISNFKHPTSHERFNNIKYLPEEFAQLNLKILAIDLDTTLKEIPDVIWKLKSLEVLRLDGRFTSISPKIAALTQLKKLEITEPNSYRIHKSAAPHMHRTVNDDNFLGSGKHFLGIESRLEKLPEAIGQLKNLTILNLSRNKLISLPESIGLLTKLTHLDASYNIIKDIPSSIYNLKQLQVLNLKGSFLSEAQQNELKSKLPQTKVIF